MEINDVDKLSALSHPHRLAVFRLLVRRYPDDVRAGEISDALRFKPNTTSVYLGALRAAKLLTCRREGTSLFYKAHMDSARDLVQFLFSDCCRERISLDLPSLAIGALSEPMRDTRTNVLFLCSGNSARSICAEALLRDMAGDRFNAFSAGTRPAACPKERALSVLEMNGHDTNPLYTKEMCDFQAQDAMSLDVVITLCDRAANEECPSWRGHPINSHWSIADPSRVSGSTVEQKAAFEQMYDQLREKISRFSDLNLQRTLRSDLQTAIDAIGANDQEGISA